MNLQKIKSLDLDSKIVGLARTVKEDIDAVVDADLEYIHTFIGTSPLHRNFKLKMSKEQVIQRAVEAIDYAKEYGLTVEFSAEDATRTERDFYLKSLMKLLGRELIF